MKFLIEAYGCTMNQGEGRLMAEMLEESGHSRTAELDDADIVLIVTCTVIGATERRMLRRIRAIREKGKLLVVAGCMAKVQRDMVLEAAPDSMLISPSEISKVVDVPSRLARTATARVIPAKGRARSFSPCEQGVEGIVPISQGCEGSCAYCIAKLVRGELLSYPTESVLSRVRKELGRGAKEIRLTALDTGCYGRDAGASLPGLIDQVASLPGEFMVRIGMMNPSSAAPILDSLLESYRNVKVFKFLHLPVQSGNEGVLQRMGRNYAVEDFERIAGRFREDFEDLTLSTDFIVGFPGEAEEEFGDSMALLERVRPDIVNITRFSARPGTAAEAMEGQVVGWRVKERSRSMNALRARICRENNTRFVGRRERVLTAEMGKNGTTVGRTMAYRPVVIREKMPLGEFHGAVVVEARDSYLVGERISNAAY